MSKEHNVSKDELALSKCPACGSDNVAIMFKVMYSYNLKERYEPFGFLELSCNDPKCDAFFEMNTSQSEKPLMPLWEALAKRLCPAIIH